MDHFSVIQVMCSQHTCQNLLLQRKKKKEKHSNGNVIDSILFLFFIFFIFLFFISNLLVISLLGCNPIF